MRPPTHGIDDPAEYVDISDPAWDLERVQGDRSKMTEVGEDPDEHPVTRFVNGISRYSLDAPSVVLGQSKTAREYLKQDPVIWELKRLGRRQYRSLQTLMRQDNVELAWEEAVRIGVDKALGPRAPRLVGGGGLELTDSDIDAIWEYDPTLIDRLGLAVVRLSRPLGAAEGKR